MYIFYKLIKFHKLVYRTLKIVTIETNIFFINLAEGYPPIPPISTEYGRNKSRLVSTLDHDSLGSENKISLPIPLLTSKGKGGIRANRSKVRHLNNLFLVLPPRSPPLPLRAPVAAREGAAGRLARRNFNGAHSDPPRQFRPLMWK